MFGPSRRDLHRALERERQRNQQRESELLDRLMFLGGKMWTPPPLVEGEPEGPPEEYVGALDVLPEEWDGPHGALEAARGSRLAYEQSIS